MAELGPAALQGFLPAGRCDSIPSTAGEAAATLVSHTGRASSACRTPLHGWLRSPRRGRRVNCSPSSALETMIGF